MKSHLASGGLWFEAGRLERLFWGLAIAWAVFIGTPSLIGQPVTVLHEFMSGGSLTNPYPGGAEPASKLVLSGDTLFGTASTGGDFLSGTIFRIATDGGGFTNLCHFSPITADGTNRDGAHPVAGLVASGDWLFGTAPDGGRWNKGTIFKVKTDGTGFTNLHDFHGFDGKSPSAGMLLAN